MLQTAEGRTLVRYGPCVHEAPMTTHDRNRQIERELADRTRLTIRDEARDQFLTLLDRPITPISEKPELEALLRWPSVLEAGQPEP